MIHLSGPSWPSVALLKALKSGRPAFGACAITRTSSKCACLRLAPRPRSITTTTRRTSSRSIIVPNTEKAASKRDGSSSNFPSPRRRQAYPGCRALRGARSYSNLQPSSSQTAEQPSSETQQTETPTDRNTLEIPEAQETQSTEPDSSSRSNALDNETKGTSSSSSPDDSQTPAAQQPPQVLRKVSSSQDSRRLLKKQRKNTATAFLEHMRYIPRPIVLVTALQYEPREEAQSPASKSPRDYILHPCIMTVSSFTSLSTDPPRVMFNVSLPSRTGGAILKGQYFKVFICKSDAQGALSASLFTGGNVERGPEELQQLEKHGLRLETTQNLARRLGSHLKTPRSRQNIAPGLTGEGLQGWIECRLHKAFPIKSPQGSQDKLIIVGNVVKVQPEDIPDNTPLSLAYANRKYRKLEDGELEVTLQKDS